MSETYCNNFYITDLAENKKIYIPKLSRAHSITEKFVYKIVRKYLITVPVLEAIKTQKFVFLFL